MENMPAHVGIIMDGNRRWAKEHRLRSLFLGHKEGAETLKKIARHAASTGIKFLSVFAFSTENLNRSKEEVDYLFSLFREAFDEHLQELEDENIGIAFLGDTSGGDSCALPRDIIAKMRQTEERSCEVDNKMTLLIAVNYGGRDEIVRAFGQILEKAKSSQPAYAVYPSLMRDLSNLSNFLDSGNVRVPIAGDGGYDMHPLNIPDVDLIIRTSGEQRTSGFLLWQAAYAELYFSQKSWPDFTPEDFDEAIAEYQRRQRRFGK